MRQIIYYLGIILLLTSCQPEIPDQYLNKSGRTISERISAPNGYTGVEENENSYEKLLQNIELKPHGSKILDFKGNPISNQYRHNGILDFEVGTKDCNSIYLLAKGYTLAQSIHILTNPFDSKLSPWYRITTSAKSTKTARYLFSKTNIRTYGE